MTVIAKGHSYKNRNSNREYLVLKMPRKRTLVNRLFRRNVTMVTVQVYPLDYKNGKPRQFPLQQMQRWSLLDIPDSVKQYHRATDYRSCARDNTELNKRLTKNGQSFYLV